jgi:hypothetical protein
MRHNWSVINSKKNKKNFERTIVAMMSSKKGTLKGVGKVEKPR